jgi:Domain of unknown function (DUF3883)
VRRVQSVPHYFTHYWKNKTWEEERAIGYEHFEGTAGNDFRKRGVEPGDFIYVITVIDGKLILGGGIEVVAILTQTEAEEAYGGEVWPAEDHAVAKPETGSPMDFDRVVPTDVVRKLRFIAGSEEVAPIFTGGEKLDNQTMRGVRKLTSESARLLDSIISGSESRGKRNGKTGPVPPPDDIGELSLDEILVEPPELTEEGHEGEERERSYRTRKIDHAARDAANRDLGERGEDFVVKYERRRLTKAGRADLAAQVRCISETEGDGAGYDVLSFDTDGREKYIELKTTTGGKKTPFIVTLNEVEFSEDHPEDFLLYRLFGFDREPGIFCPGGLLEGAIPPRSRAVQGKVLSGGNRGVTIHNARYRVPIRDSTHD